MLLRHIGERLQEEKERINSRESRPGEALVVYLRRKLLYVSYLDMLWRGCSEVQKIMAFSVERRLEEWRPGAYGGCLKSFAACAVRGVGCDGTVCRVAFLCACVV